jgi:cation:H+ antiporter
MASTLAVFAGLGALLVLAGTLMAQAADAIAERTRLGRVWVGTVLLAAATSLPELVTDVASVRIGARDLAAGDLFGSVMVNMLILALIDLLASRGRVFREAAISHALSAALSMALCLTAAVFLLLRPTRTLWGIGLGGPLLFVLFLLGSRVIYLYSLRDTARAAPTAEHKTWTLRRAIVYFAAGAAVTFGAAPFFAWSADRLAQATGLGHSFVGTLLVGLATSLPELVSSLTAVRMGAFDLAVGNLFGSNAFNMAIFFALDLAYRKGPIFAAVSPVHAVTALFATLLMALGLAGLVYRAERRWSLLEPTSALMVVVYLVALWLLYSQTVTG